MLYLDSRIYFSFPVTLPVSEKDCSHAFSATNEYHLCFAWISVSISVFRRTSEYRLLFWCGFPVLESILSGQTSGFAWLLDIQFFQLPTALSVSENRPLPRNFRDKRASALLYLDSRIYFSFPVTLPVSEKDCSHAFSATNEYHLCFAWISVSISVFRRTSEYRLLFWCGFPVLESILSGQTSGFAWLLDIQFFQLPAALSVSENRPLPRNFRDKWASALLGFPYLFQLSSRTSCFGKRLLPSNFTQQMGIGFVWIPFLFQLSAALSCFRKWMTSA
ncbi:hypothetical protein DXF96_07885 [Heyndrickxia coagulans]|nr:hypothetical protein CYJ15_02325 [Heyndrickxia coagulans]QDI61411.1 hypothetical protein DXF96_07885 [Heyndrickxia coagulans]